MSDRNRPYIDEKPVDERRAVASYWLWFAFFTPATAWGVHLLLNYFLESLFCQARLSNVNLWLNVSTAILLALTIAAGVVGWWAWSAAGIGDDTSEATNWGLSGFLGISGLIMSVLFGLAIIMGDFGVFYLSSCHQFT